MGEPLGIVFWKLRNDVTWLATYWQEYIELFATNKEDVELLNNCASGFFSMVQNQIWDETLLHVARLTDMPGKGKHRRVTVRMLPDMVDSAIEPAVQKAILDIEDKASFCRDHRHRRIAHNSLELLLNDKAEPLASGNTKAMNEVIGAIEDVLNVIAGHYLDTSMSFKMARLAGAKLLLRKLRIGSKAEEEVRAQIGRGDLPRGFLYL